MTSLTKSLLFLCLIAFSVTANAQFEKIEMAVEDSNYKRVEKLSLDNLESQAMKKYPETYYYYAQALYFNAKNPLYFEKHPEAIKLAVKSLKKGRKKDENDGVFESFSDVVDGIVERQNEQALAQFKINKMSRAMVMFDDAYALNGNRYAYYMAGKCALLYQDSAKCEKHYKQLIVWNSEDKAKGDEEAFKTVEPFAYFIDKYWQKKQYDSAKYYISTGRKFFNNDAKINFYHKKVTLDQLKGMPPSNLMLEYVQESLSYIPVDEELLHQENALFIYLIKNKLKVDQQADADTLISKFINEKVAKSQLKQAEKIKETDVFVEKKSENVLWKLAEYFQTYKHLQASDYILEKYIQKTAKSNSEADVAARWSVITDYAYQTKELPFASFILQKAIERYPGNTELKALRSKIIKEKEYLRIDVDEQGALYSLMIAEYNDNKSDENLDKILQVNDKYLGLLIAANRFSSARDVMAEQMAFAPDQNHSERLEYIAREDFYQNYFLTKTRGKDQNGVEIEAFEWSGSTSDCDAGKIDLGIQNKVANRINYFRRNAGVTEVLFDAATNEFCQDAALMMTANRKLDHNPTKSWRCFTDEGAYAAKHSLLIKDANTSMAVTYIMADKNPGAGNRRWLLYPNGKVYGHGSTNDVAVIWALDDSGSTDTMQYMDNPVCWPPKGDVPQIMLFDNWTFSLYRDLSNAKVEVVQDGKPLEVNVEQFVSGYGAPTLVFKPTFNKMAMPKKSKFDVKVTLSDGRNYSYIVRTFYYNPAK